jgi:MOSC domain-containing protein YiiM
MGQVVAVCSSPTHSFSKPTVDAIRLLAGLGVEGDAHCGHTVQHRSRIAADPSQPNLRQVHLIHTELHQELRAKGFSVYAGQMGENITTMGVDLLSLPVAARLRLGDEAIIEITGLRNPCTQLDSFSSGLMSSVLDRDGNGRLIRKSGIMGIVLIGGIVRPGDTIKIELPTLPLQPLDRV